MSSSLFLSAAKLNIYLYTQADRRIYG